MPSTAQEPTALLISEREAAQKLGLSGRTMFNLRQDGEIPFVPIRSRIMYRVSALEKWIESQEQWSKQS